MNLESDLLQRGFIMTEVFDKKWDHLGLTDDDLRDLQNTLCLNPKKGDVIQDTGGLRKIRVALHGTGKSKGARVLYVDFELYEILILISAYERKVPFKFQAKQKKVFKNFILVAEKELKSSKVTRSFKK